MLALNMNNINCSQNGWNIKRYLNYCVTNKLKFKLLHTNIIIKHSGGIDFGKIQSGNSQLRL